MKRKYGLVGYPLGHSFSRSFFQQKFEDEHINATYENFEIQDISCLRQFILDNHELCGLNVTIPHKTAVIPHIYRKGTNKDRKSLELIDIYCPIHRITKQKCSLWVSQKKKVNLQKRHKKRVL